MNGNQSQQKLCDYADLLGGEVVPFRQGNAAVALELAKRGFLVFPMFLRQAGAWTGNTGWQEHASTDPAIVAAWWRKAPEAAIGLLAGEPNGFCVLDIDRKNGVDGFATLRALGLDPETMSPVRVRTPSGGMHVYFAPEPRLKNWAGKLGAGLDTRTTGGLVLAPGSTKGGGFYESVGVPLGTVELPPFPAALIPPAQPERGPVEPLAEATAEQREWAADQLAERCADLAATPEGQREHTLNAAAMWAGGAAAHGFLDEAEAKGELEAAALACGLPAREIRAKLTRSWTDGLRKPIAEFPGRAVSVDDIFDEEPETADALSVPVTPKPGRVLVTKRGEVARTLQNAVVFAGRVLRGRRLRWNLLAGGAEIVVDKSEPRRIDDHDLAALRIEIECTGMHSLGKDLVADAVRIIARADSYHPVQEHLEALPAHDGRRRLDSWLVGYLGVDDTPYARVVGRKFLVAMIARAMLPGCKADHMLVLGGDQDIGKSTVCAILADRPEWFLDALPDIGKDGGDPAMKALRGKWIVEVGEMVATRKSEQEDLKAFISRQVDEYRLAYDREQTAAPRQCVLIGTTNRREFLRDDTGDRRYWPVWCNGPLKLDDMKADRSQLLAEALAAFRSGDTWHLDRAESALARVEQAAYAESDPWDDALRTALAGRLADRAEMTMGEVLWEGLGIEIERQSRVTHLRAAAVMRRLGWVKGHTRVGKRWRRPSADMTR